LTSNNELRRKLRNARRRIPAPELHYASNLVCERIIDMPEFRKASRIAAYVGSQGEIDPMPLLRLAHELGKLCYLPVLHPFMRGRLWFAPWSPHSRMFLNPFGIPEPLFQPAQICKPQFFDVVLTPLLGFDRHCHRLGMGGGYYDRTFAFRNTRQQWKGPSLIGLAHAFQLTDRISTQPWDVQLDSVVTPDHLFLAD